jgi:polar amino acid transport system substrate-binding protein
MKSSLLTLLGSAIVAAVVSLGILFAWHPSTTPSSPQQSAYSKILASGTIRAAYAVGAPLFIINPNTGQKSGIFYDIVTAAAAHLGLKVDWTAEVGYGEMIQGLDANRYDIVGSGVWINADRGKGADFTIPLYYDAVYAYARTGDARFNSSLSTLNSPTFIISTMDGELGATIAQADYPLAKRLQLPQSADFSQLIQNVVAGKADVVFLSASAASAYQAKNPGQIKIVNSNKPLRIFADAIMIPQGQYELRQALDYALQDMLNDGEINSILAKYESVPGSFLRVAPPYQQNQ